MNSANPARTTVSASSPARPGAGSLTGAPGFGNGALLAPPAPGERPAPPVRLADALEPEWVSAIERATD